MHALSKQQYTYNTECKVSAEGMQDNVNYKTLCKRRQYRCTHFP